MSRGSTVEETDDMATSADDESTEENRRADLEHLGAPPYYRALLLRRGFLVVFLTAIAVTALLRLLT